MSVRESGEMVYPSGEEMKGRVTCEICGAVYRPARWREDLWSAPSMAVESAFMSMCHFCFRCRRPACPECWDDVHGVCGECVEEAQLPFRKAAAPLGTVLFSAPRQPQLRRECAEPAPFVCVRPGRFRGAAQDVVDEEVSASMKPEQEDVTEIETRPERGKERKTRGIKHGINRDAVSQVRTAGGEDVAEVETWPERGKGGRWLVVERVLTVVLSGILLIVIGLVVAASVSEEANTFIVSVLYVDIRAEIAYLWQLIMHLF